jgi:hypothetical protein
MGHSRARIVAYRQQPNVLDDISVQTNQRGSKFSRTRRCTECKRTFASPETFRVHRHKGSVCRTEEALVASGFRLTPKGWLKVLL